MTQTPPKSGRYPATNGNGARNPADDLATGMSRSSASLPPNLVGASGQRMARPMPQPPQVVLPSPQPAAVRSVANGMKLPGFGTLRGRLLLTLLPAVVVPLLAFGFGAGQVAHQQAEEELEERTEKLAELASNAFATELEEGFAHAEQIALNPLAIDAARAGGQFAEAEGLAELPDDRLEEQFSATNLLQPNQRLNDYLRQVAVATETVEVFFTERNGLNIAYSNKTGDLVQRDEEWWQAGKAETQWVGHAEFDESANAFSIDLAQAITDPASGEFLGVLKVVLPAAGFDTISDFLNDVGLTKTARVQLVDIDENRAEAGAGNSSAEESGVLFTVTGEGTEVSGELTGGESLHSILLLMQELLEGGASNGQVQQRLDSQFSLKDLSLGEFDGDEVREGEFLDASFLLGDRFYSVVVSGKNHFAAVSSISHDELKAAGQGLKWNLFGAAFASSVLLGGVILWLSGQLSKPLNRLAGTAQTVAAGNLDVLAEPSGTEETQTLANNFNALVTRVRGLLQRQARTNEETLLLAEIAGANTQTEADVRALLDLAVSGARRQLGAERVVLYRFNPDWTGTVVAESAIAGFPSALNSEMQEACIPEHVRNEYALGKVAANTDVFDAGFHPDRLKLLIRLGIKSNLITPVVAGGKIFGLLIAHYCSRQHAWNADEQINFKRIADQLGLSLSRFVYVEQVESTAEEQRLLADIAGASTQTDEDILDLFNITARGSRKLLGSDRVVLYRFNPDWSGSVVAEDAIPGLPKALNNRVEDACIPETIRKDYLSGKVLANDDVFAAGFHPDHEALMARLKIASNLITPVVAGGLLFGLLIAHYCNKQHSWSDDEQTRLKRFADQLGLSLNRVVYVEQVQKVAEEQRQLKEILQKRALELLMQVDPVSQGDLTIRAKVTEDEIGTIADSYNATVGSLRKIVQQVQDAAQKVAATTTTSETSVGDLAREALAQADDISAALDRIQTMTMSARVVAESAEKAEQTVQQTAQTVQAGDEAMNRTVDGFMAIRETVADATKKVKRLGEASQKISKVVSLIGGFTDQTNLLALNASIEAAHAGEEGKGFAVVADEVRSLARQSADATAEIEALVAEIQGETNEVVAAMETGTQQVVAGTQLVEETRQNLNQITRASSEIENLVNAIAQAASEQTLASEVVAQTMTEVAAVSGKTSTSVSDVSESFKQLQTVAQQLQETVSQFKLS
ncbi:methyl-accepting chemotaxis protein [Synechococcus sp. PCC 7336]|uniref:methyl-accepting chemotaxis protein n=1 Tax=Synechococcus sp. PCC 7336 TaxID=195250 RepID=UPI00034D9ABD|nr:methyl-accepting chemotaxis protein [Synechococcus sp. PCC 7336]